MHSTTSSIATTPWPSGSTTCFQNRLTCFALSAISISVSSRVKPSGTAALPCSPSPLASFDALTKMTFSSSGVTHELKCRYTLFSPSLAAIFSHFHDIASSFSSPSTLMSAPVMLPTQGASMLKVSTLPCWKSSPTASVISRNPVSPWSPFKLTYTSACVPAFSSCDVVISSS